MRLLTPDETADLLTISRSAFYRLRQANSETSPAPLRLGPQTIRFRSSDIEDWIDRKIQQPTRGTAARTAAQLLDR